jgi:hypothetical protein
MHATFSVGQVYSMLTQLDENSDGVINVAHLKRALAEIVVPAASADDVAATVDFVNVNGERFVDLHEVVRTPPPSPIEPRRYRQRVRSTEATHHRSAASEYADEYAAWRARPDRARPARQCCSIPWAARARA